MARSNWYTTRPLPRFQLRSGRLRRRVSGPHIFDRSSAWAAQKLGFRSWVATASFRSSYRRHHTEAFRFFLNQLPHGVLELQKSRIAFEAEIAWTRKRDLEDVFDSARTRAHDDNTIGK